MNEARHGRGKGNGSNKNWHNSPLWDNIEKKKKENSDKTKQGK